MRGVSPAKERTVNELKLPELGEGIEIADVTSLIAYMFIGSPPPPSPFPDPGIDPTPALGCF